MSAEHRGDLEPEQPKADRLRAIADLSEATRLVDLITDKNTREDTTLKLSISQALCKQRPVYSVDQARALVKDRDYTGIYHRDSFRDLAFFEMASGKPDVAFETAFNFSSKFSWDFGKLAILAKERGVDFAPSLHQAWHQLRSSDYQHAGKIAILHRQLEGEVPVTYLDRFNDEAHTNNGIWGNDRRIDLAQVYAKAGYPEIALEIWHGTQPDQAYGREYAVSLVNIALAFAQKKIDPSQYLEKATSLAERIRVTKDYDPSWHQSQIYSSMAEVAGTFGLDPKPYFDKAAVKATQHGTNLEVDGFISLARAQLKLGIDPRATLKLAREKLEEHLPDAELGETDKASVMKQVDLYELARVYLAINDYDKAREYIAWVRGVMERTNDYKIASSVNALAELAFVEYRGKYPFMIDDIDFSPFEP